jgi:hypothetical protein
MASLDFLKEEMASARKLADDKTKPFNVRRASESRFWHCLRRVDAMERSGAISDTPGTYMKNYSEY